MTADHERTLRSDARRSMEILIDAARTAFAEQGLDVSTNEIVKRAGVGPATFYRRFPSRLALVETVLSEVLLELEEQAKAALDHPDPATGFAGLFTALTVAQTENKGLSDALAGHKESTRVNEARRRLRDLIRAVTERAQAAGALRPDLSWRDVPFLASAASAVATACLDLRAGAEQRDRVLTVLFAGLRAGDGPALPGRPPRHIRGRR
ncbi:hypothetical protein BAY59_27550 [Prauserella coralliicola]|nr:hypothetical protein BAY59_27550 [Prauserella coralliicola]